MFHNNKAAALHIKKNQLQTAPSYCVLKQRTSFSKYSVRVDSGERDKLSMYQGITTRVHAHRSAEQREPQEVQLAAAAERVDRWRSFSGTPAKPLGCKGSDANSCAVGHSFLFGGSFFFFFNEM